MQEQAHRRRDVVVFVHQVDVVENDDARRAGPQNELVEQLLDHIGQGSVSPQHRDGVFAAIGCEHLQRSDQAGPEAGAVAVALVKRQPRNGERGMLHPSCQQQRLASPGWGDDEGEWRSDHVVQQLEEALPKDVVLGSSGGAQLGAQQR